MSYADECLERANRAAPGPWEPSVSVEDWGLGCVTNRRACGPTYQKGGQRKVKRDAEFIAAARFDVVELATRLTKAIQAMRDPLYIESPGYFRCLADKLEEMPK